MTDIFISYRTADAAHGAAACYELLAAQFGGDRVFRDCVSMLPGQDYPDEITAALERARVLIAIIGPRWLAADAAGSRLIDNPRDWVRREIARALARDILVIPLLLDDAPLPSPDDLPADIAALTRRQVARVRHQLLGPDVRRLADQIAQLVPRLEAPPGRASVPSRVPPRRSPAAVPAWNGPVVPRPELHAEIVSLLVARARPVALTTALRGAGGFGKTVLAAEVCRDPEVVARFPGGILWVTLGDRPVELTEMVNDLCRRLRSTGEESPPLENLDQAGQELGRLLDGRGPVLLVVDDVWSAADLRPFLYGGTDCVRLVTTRMATALPDGTRQVRVDELTPEQSRTLLTRGLPDLDGSVADELVRLTGRWALLLALVNRAVAEAVDDGAEPSAAAAHIAATLRRDGPAALDLGDEKQRERLVGATIDVSLSFLSPADRDRFLLLGVFHEDVWIPEDLLAVLWPGEAARLCRQLARMSLLARRVAGEAAAVRLHDVVRDYVRSHRDLAADHGWLIERVGSLAPHGWWELPPDAEYLWRWLPYHLREAGRPVEHAALVTDLRWIAAKTQATGPLAVEADLVDVAGAAGLRHALAQSAHLLAPTNPPSAVVAVLLSRLHAFPSLRPHVEAFPAAPPRLANHWPLPDLPDPALLRVITGHGEPLNACAWSSDGTLLASGGQDGVVRVWDVTRSTWEHEPAGHPAAVNACAWSLDGMLATACDDGVVRLWQTGHQRSSFAHEGAATGCAWSGTLLASCGRDGFVRVWDNGTQLSVLGEGGSPANGCAWSPDGTRVAAAYDDGVVRVWNMSGGLEAELVGHTGWVSACAWSSSGLLASCGQDGLARIWDVASGVQKTELTAGTGWVTDCAWSPDGTFLAVAGDDGVLQVWAVATARQHSAMTGHSGWLGTCAWSPDGTLLASAGHDATVRVWDVARGTGPAGPTSHSGTVHGLAWSPDGRCLASGGDDQTVRLWDTSGENLGVLTGHAGPVRECVWSPDGTLLASASDDETICLWDTGKQVRRAEIVGHTGWVYGCAWSPDGTRIASAGDQTVRIWDSGTGTEEVVLTGHTGWVNACAWSPDGTRIASAGDQTVRIWDSGTGTEEVVLTGHTGWVNACAWSPDGTLLASVSEDRTTRVWNPWDGSLLAELTGHTGHVRSCDWSPDGTLLATVGDRSARVWDWRTGRCATIMRTEEELFACAWSPTTPLLALAGNGGVYVFAYHP